MANDNAQRDWFDEVQRLEKENEELRSEVKRLDLMVSQADHNYEMKRNDIERQLAERDAQLSACIAALREAGDYRSVASIEALSASAEPKYDVVQHNSDRYVGIELAGVMREYLDMPCASLQQRMRATIERYKPRIDAMVKAHQGLPELTGEEPSVPKCCAPTDEELKLLADGDYTPEELWGVGRKPSCADCHGSKPSAPKCLTCHVRPDQTLCRFYEITDYPGLVRELVEHVSLLQDSAKRNVKPWEDTFPPTLLPAYIERVNAANQAEQPSPAAVVMPKRPHVSEEEQQGMTEYEIGLGHGACEMWDEVKRLNTKGV